MQKGTITSLGHHSGVPELSPLHLSLFIVCILLKLLLLLIIEFFTINFNNKIIVNYRIF